MEEELTCPSCRQFLRHPVLLHCAHSYCRQCALKSQIKCSSSSMMKHEQQPNFVPSLLKLSCSSRARNSLTSPVQFSSSSSGSSDAASLNVSDADSVEEKISLASESDSGVVLSPASYWNCISSRPSSFTGQGSNIFHENSFFANNSNSFSTAAVFHQDTQQQLHLPSQQCLFLQQQNQQMHTPRSFHLQQPTAAVPSTSGYVIVCEKCQKPSYFADEHVIEKCPENIVVSRILAKYLQSKNAIDRQESVGNQNFSLINSIKTDSTRTSPVLRKSQNQSLPNCQWCEGKASTTAKFHCEICGYFYCEDCQPVIHPPRGPLKTHQLICLSTAGNEGPSHPKPPLQNGQPPKSSCGGGSVNEAVPAAVEQQSSRCLTICAGPAASSPLSSTSSSSTTTTASSLLHSAESLSTLSIFRQNNLASTPRQAAAAVGGGGCVSHPDATPTMYCMDCHELLCSTCVDANNDDALRHAQHDLKSVQNAAKTKKTTLSQILQALGNKAKHATEEVSQLRHLHDRINERCDALMTDIEQQFDSLLALLNRRRQSLLDFLVAERDRRKFAVKEQIARCNSHLSKTASLVQFSIEILKESDSAAYLQISESIFNRVTDHELHWHEKMPTAPMLEVLQFELDVDTSLLQQHINDLGFTQLKAPSTPQFEIAHCAADNNAVRLAWRSPISGAVADGYILEMDSGQGNKDFKEVFCGPEAMCEVNGLHFNSLYTARVKAFSAAIGSSSYSQPICLQTAPVAWFRLDNSCSNDNNGSSDRALRSPDLVISDEGSTVIGTTTDYRTILGNVAFSRGVHYWEVSINNYDGNADIVLGVAQPSVDKSLMLGKDAQGWSMYIDFERSWFFHNGNHHGRRPAGVVGQGSLIGVLMDCDRGTLWFSIGGAPLPTAAFRNMPRGHYFPAFSVNCNASITVHSGLLVPCSFTESLLASTATPSPSSTNE